MKAQELRIGNLLSYDGTVVQVSNIGCNGFETHKTHGIIYGSCDLADYDPIPLTEKWLIDFRFVGNGQGLFDKYTGHLNFWQFTIYASKTGMVLRQPVSIKVYQVHQLQNLYFALTGEELQL